MNSATDKTTSRAASFPAPQADSIAIASGLEAMARLASCKGSPDTLPQAVERVLAFASRLAGSDAAILRIGTGPLAQPHLRASVGRFTVLDELADMLLASGVLVEPQVVWIGSSPVGTGDIERARAAMEEAGVGSALFVSLRSSSGRWSAVFAVGYVAEQRPAEHAFSASQAVIRHAVEHVECEHAAAEVLNVNESLRHEVELAHKFFDAAVVGMYLTDAAGTLLRVNRAYAKVFGYEVAELQGMHFTELLPPASREAAHVVLKARVEGDSSPREWPVIRKDGTSRIVCVHGASAIALGGRQYVLGALHDITDERRAIDALRESEERFRALADSSPAPIWMTGAKGELLFINESYVRFFGRTAEEVRGSGWQPLIHPEDRAAYSDAFYAASESRQPFRAQARVRNAQGEWRWVSSHALPRLSASGEFLGMVGISPDVTEVKRAQDQLARANEALERRVAERTERLRETIHELETFSYSMAHDIRAPLRSMRGFAELLLEEHAAELGAPAKDYLARIARSAGRLDLLTRDVLSYSRIVRGEMQLEPVDVDVLLRGILESYPNLHPSRGDIRIQSPLPAVEANAAALTQVLANLLDNALKFVAPGVRPVVAIRAEARPAAADGRPGRRVRIWVEDNGIGIEPEIQPKVIFGMFERLHPGEFDGTGMGLTLARKAVERMGGSIGVDSVPGRGSSFWFELNPAT